MKKMIEKTLMYSLKNHKVISIIYMKGGEFTQRKIQVLKIQEKLIKALDLDKKDIRSFKIENILSAIDEKILIEN